MKLLPAGGLGLVGANSLALSALAVGFLMQRFKHGGFRAFMDFFHLHRMGFASLYPSYESPCVPRRDALEEESWSSRQRPTRRPNGVVAQGDEWHGCHERRDWPWMALRAGPRSGDGVREPRRSRGRMMGQALLVSFGAIAKRDSPGKAKQELSAKLGNQLGSILPTLDADMANSFAKGNAIAPGVPGEALRPAGRMNSPLQCLCAS